MIGHAWNMVCNIVYKELIQVWRYKLLLFVVLLFPVIDLMGAKEATTTEVMHVPTAVYDGDHSEQSRRVVNMLRGSGMLDIDYYAGSQAELEELLMRGTAKVGLSIPAGFGADLEGGRGATIQALLDGTETTTSVLAGAYLEGMAYVYAGRVANGGLSVDFDKAVGVESDSRVWFNEELRREIFHIPAEMTSVIAMLAVLLPAVAIVRERESGTLEQLFVTPISPAELVVGKSLPAMALTYLAFLVMMALNTFHLHVPLRGSPALLMVLAGYYIFVEMGVGLLISAVVRTQGQALMAAFLWMMVESVLSGQLLPVDNMPRPVQVVAMMMPNTHFNLIVRGIMLRGIGLAELWPRVVALAVLGAVLYFLVVTRLEKSLE